MKQNIRQRRRLRANALARAEKRRSECEAAYSKTRSHVWLARLRDAVTNCLRLSVPA